MATFHIVETRQIHSTHPASVSGFATLVTYADAAGRLASIIVEADAPTIEQIQQTVKDAIAQRTQHTGKTFEA
ncbi:MAG: hypothetical protein IVW36_12400 [Dehalococcoidia bacterium]|nr:hypothetical protein [Dehalococcoidia bacterium]